MEYVKKKFVDEENRVISWFSTDDNILCNDGKTLREKVDELSKNVSSGDSVTVEGCNITYISPSSFDEFVELTKEGGLFYLLTTIPLSYNNKIYNVVGFIDSRPHINGYSYYSFHKMWQFLIDLDTKAVTSFSSFSEFIQKKIPSDASKLSIIDANNNFTSTNVEGALEEVSTQFKDIANEIGTETLNTTAQDVKGAINEVFQNVSNGKQLIATAITDKGVNTSSDDTFQVMATNIGKINGIDGAIVQIKGITYRLSTDDTGKVIATKTAGVEGLIEGRILLWNEDFEGTSVDTNTWTFDDRDKYNNRLNCWTGGAVTTVKDSVLHIKAVKQTHGSYTAEWSSDQLWTRKKYANSNCRWECKMKFDVMNGCWPAFWLMGDNFTGTGPEAGQGGIGWPACGELDVMEFMGGANGSLSANAHWSNYNTTEHKSKGLGSYTNKIVGDLSDWHIYGCEMSETQITFDVDGTTFKTWDISEANVDYGNAFKLPMYPLISLQVGLQGGTPDDTASEMNVYVDWVRCYAPVGTTVYGEIEGINIIGVNTELAPGITQIANVEYTPLIAINKTLSWSSSNESVVDVKNGVITSVSDGNATITATSKNGIESSIDMTVSTTASYPVTNITFDDDNYDTIPVVEGSSYIPSISIEPEGYTDKITYSSSENSIFTINSNTGEVTPVSPGKANIIVTSDSGVTAQREVEVVSKNEDAYIKAIFNGKRYQGDEGVGNLTRGSKAYPLNWNAREWEYTLVLLLNGINRGATFGFITSDANAGGSYRPVFMNQYNPNTPSNYIRVASEDNDDNVNLLEMTLPATIKLAYVVKNGTIKYYKNGTLIQTRTIKAQNSWIKSPTSHIGCRCDSTVGNSEMRMYRRALSETEVISITTL